MISQEVQIKKFEDLKVRAQDAVARTKETLLNSQRQHDEALLLLRQIEDSLRELRGNLSDD